MAAPVYRREQASWLSRGLSLVPFAWFLWLVFQSENPRAGAGIITPLIPLAVIWFPATAGQICREKVSSKTASHLGWVALLGLTVLPMWAWWKVGRW